MGEGSGNMEVLGGKYQRQLVHAVRLLEKIGHRGRAFLRDAETK